MWNDIPRGPPSLGLADFDRLCPAPAMSVAATETCAGGRVVTAGAPIASTAQRGEAAPRVARARRRRRRFGRTGWNAVAIVLLVVMVFPVYWMVSTAFQPTNRINSLT